MDYDSAMRAAKTEYDRWLSTSEPWLKRKSGRPKGSKGVKRTHCRYGHAYLGDNVYLDARGCQHCRCCARLRARADRLHKRMTAA